MAQIGELQRGIQAANHIHLSRRAGWRGETTGIMRRSLRRFNRPPLVDLAPIVWSTTPAMRSLRFVAFPVDRGSATY